MIVGGEGELSSKIWLIGEAPGTNEDRLGRPFVGGAGQVLDGILTDVGIKRAECYIDNIMQQQPLKNDFSVYYKDKSCTVPTEALLDGHKRIQDLVRAHRPNVVVALGNESLYGLTGKRQILKWRGSILGCGGVKVIPTVHPALVMRQYEYRPVAVLDFNRVKRESESPDFPPAYKDNFITNPKFDMVMAYLKEILPKKPYIAFDIETQQNQITCIGFAWSKEDAICIPIFYGGTSYWNPQEELEIIKAVRELFSNESIRFIAQNGQYDMVYMADKWGVDVKNYWMDTMVGFHCVYPELRKALGFIMSIYTNRPYHKDDGEGGPNNLWTYNCKDTVGTYECAFEIRKELEEFKTLEFYENHSHRIIKPLINMQRRGVRIDLQAREAIDKNLESSLLEMQSKLDAAVGHPLNPNSPKQMLEFLYTELKLPKQVNRKTGNATADEDAIETLAKAFPNPIFDLILDIRGVRKLLSTYIRAPLDSDGRIRCAYVITGTETGRLSARESVYGTGTNLQNIPRLDAVRAIFIPDPGYKFVNADLSQAEARVVAYLAEDIRLQNVFADTAGDIHKRNAAMVFNKRIEEVTPDERQLAKTLVHAANYCVGARTFGKNIGISEARAQGLLNQYYALYPCVKLWHMKVESELRRCRILRTPLGRARMFFGRWSQDLIREAIAYVPQSTVSDIINYGIIRADPNMPQHWTMHMQNHDAFLMQVPEYTDDMHIYKFCKHYFENPITINGKTFKIPVDIKVGKNWANMEKLKL